MIIENLILDNEDGRFVLNYEDMVERRKYEIHNIEIKLWAYMNSHIIHEESRDVKELKKLIKTQKFESMKL